MKKMILLISCWILPFMAFTEKPFIPWEKLSNPVYEKDDWSVKDATMIYVEEKQEFYLFFSAFFHVGDRVNSHVVSVKTKDWIHFSDPLFLWDGKELGYHGVCSPEINYIEGKYILSYNGWGDKKGKLNQLYYAVSTDLENWEKHIPLGRDVTKGYRAIDADIAFHEDTYYLFYKESRPFGHLPRVDLTRVAYANDIDGPWQFAYSGYLQYNTLDTAHANLIHENFSSLQIDGTWHLLTSGYFPHEPYLFEIGGDADDKGWWGVWNNGRMLEIPPREGFNTAHKANASHLKDWRHYDGYFYLLFAGNTENETFWTRGHNRLGLARSKDLINWEFPE
ncbi:MAG: hypothetical protein ACOCYO_02200 [Bacteroidota bacterium]